jgi:hypothetical protein
MTSSYTAILQIVNEGASARNPRHSIAAILSRVAADLTLVLQ